MDTVINLALTAAWLVLGALLAYSVFDAWRRGERLPFFRMLERHGLSVAQAEEAAGREALAAALRRCELCSDRKACARALAVDWLGRGPLACGPNAEFFEQVKGAEVQHTLARC
ncbi:MAG: hypothetical protein HY527_00630 [Betaproteobacteria bacterium]|nr:hypothetical protein [Betaproteobacteria bacterium]